MSGIMRFKNYTRYLMNKFALFILLLQLPFYMHAADSTSDGAAAKAESGSASSGLKDDPDDMKAMNAAVRDPYASHVDISGMESYAHILGMSADSSARSFTGALSRWLAKQSGALQPDIAGVGSLPERKTTEATYDTFTTMLAPEKLLDQDALKRTCERQTAAMMMGCLLLKDLQKFNRGEKIPDIMIQIQAAQQLLTVNEQVTLAPTVTAALKEAIAVARYKTAHQIQTHQKQQEE